MYIICIYNYVYHACMQTEMTLILAGHVLQTHFDFLVSLVRTKFSSSFCYQNIPEEKKYHSGFRNPQHWSIHRPPISSWKESWAWWHHRRAISPAPIPKFQAFRPSAVMIFPGAWCGQTRNTWCLIHVLNLLALNLPDPFTFDSKWKLATEVYGLQVSHFELKISRQAERRKHTIFVCFVCLSCQNMCCSWGLRTRFFGGVKTKSIQYIIYQPSLGGVDQAQFYQFLRRV